MAKTESIQQKNTPDTQEESSPARLTYDPDQDPAEKRQIRRDLRKLLSKANEQKANIRNVKISDIQEGLAKGNSLFHKVKDTSEATLDSKFLLIASDMGVVKAKAMKIDGAGFDADDFVAKMVTYIGDRAGIRAQSEFSPDDDENEEKDGDGNGSMLDWKKVGILSTRRSRQAPAIDFMLGPLSSEMKQRKKTTRARFEKTKEVERAPQQLTEEDIQRSENETTKNVKMISDLLVEQGRINLFHFITNPQDFGQTVENLFYVSFLVRDGVCALEFDEETEEPMIFACEKPTQDDYRDGIRRQQIVMELDMTTWEHAIKVFNITRCIIPHRVSPHPEAVGKWVG